MNIGSLNRRVAILRYTEQKDEFGSQDGEWHVSSHRWACVEENGGSESYTNEQNQARRNIKVTIRYTPDLQETDRLMYKKRIFEINSISDHKAGHYMMEINCTELIDNGL